MNSSQVVEWTVEGTDAVLPPIRSATVGQRFPTVARDGWLAISGLAGYTGTRRVEQVRRLDGLFGEGSWYIAWRLGDAVIDRSEAIRLYEDAYFECLGANRETTDWLCRTASDVYDNCLTNVASGLDYSIQEASSTNLQDIAVRRCLLRLGRRLEGDHPVEIRGVASEGYRLNPGIVPLHRPSEIHPSEEKGWWEPGTVEAFWQQNKVVVVALGAVRGRPAFAGPEGIWADLDGSTCLLVPPEESRFFRVSASKRLRRRTNGPAARDLSKIVGSAASAETLEALAAVSRRARCDGRAPRIEWEELLEAD